MNIPCASTGRVAYRTPPIIICTLVLGAPRPVTATVSPTTNAAVERVHCAATGVLVGVGVLVGMTVKVGVAVAVAVAVEVGVEVCVAVLVAVATEVAVAVGVGGAVAVGCGCTNT